MPNYVTRAAALDMAYTDALHMLAGGMHQSEVTRHLTYNYPNLPANLVNYVIADALG